MENHSTVLQDVLLLLAAAVVAVALFRRLRLPPLLAYLAVGMLVGPYGAGWLADDSDTRLMAELGVVFLLFTVGLEFSLAQLIAMRREVLGLGGAQVVITTAAAALAALLTALTAAWASAAAGLSLSLGAFLAGMLLGESEFRHQVEADIRPFRDVLLGLFFVTVGMSVDPAQLPALAPWALLLLLAALLLSKFASITALALLASAANSPRRICACAPATRWCCTAAVRTCSGRSGCCLGDDATRPGPRLPGEAKHV